MGASPSELNYRVALGRSRFASTWILGAGLATLVLVAALPIAATPRVLLVLWIGASWLDGYRVVALRVGSRAATQLVLQGSEIDVCDGRGEWHRGVLAHPCFVAPWLTVIRWLPGRARLARSIIVMPDALEAERFRRLRVLLRWA